MFPYTVNFAVDTDNIKVVEALNEEIGDYFRDNALEKAFYASDKITLFPFTPDAWEGVIKKHLSELREEELGEVEGEAMEVVAELGLRDDKAMLAIFELQGMVANVDNAEEYAEKELARYKQLIKDNV